jgi:hypothetical protein
MQIVYVSNRGDGKNDGLTKESAVHSWQRVKALCKGNNEIHLMEGDSTLIRLNGEILQATRRHPE